jgi:hypothetical protein
MLAWLVIPDWLKKWAAIVGGVIVATLAAVLYGRRQGEKAIEQRDEAREAKTLGRAVDARAQAEEHVRELPKADADPVVGKPGVPRSSVDELHRDWSRD